MSEVITEKPKKADNGSGLLRTAYISAPRSIDTSYVRKTLEAKGVRTFSPDQLDLPGQDLSQILRSAMESADLIIAILDPTPASNFVLYELGFAQAMSKPTLVLLSGDVSPSTWNASGIPYFRFDPANPSGLEFGLNQILKVPHHGTSPRPVTFRKTHSIGTKADEFLNELRNGGKEIEPMKLESLIERAIRESGVTTISKSGENEKHVDMAVWSDDLSPWVGNPLPIEVRRHVRSLADVATLVGKLVQAMTGGNMTWGLLIYLDAVQDMVSTISFPNIVHISAEDFIEKLRTLSFGEIVRGLRNQRVHGRS